MLLFFLHQINTSTNTVILMDHHLEQIQKHCRICGNRLGKSKGKKIQPVYACTDHVEDLNTFVEIHSSEDDLTVPQNFCNACYLRISRAKKAKASHLPFPQITAMEWTPHQDEGCTVRGEMLHYTNL